MKTSKRVLMLALVLGLMTVIVLNFYVRSIADPGTAAEAKRDVVVAKNTIPEHTRITTDMLEIESLPGDAVHSEAVSSVNEVAGGISNSIIVQGEQVLSSRVIVDETRASLSYRVPENMRAIAIPVGDISSVAGYISPGDKIDILVTYSDSAIADETTTYTTLQNVKVLTTGDLTEPKDDANREGGTMVVVVTPAQAEVLAYAYLQGSFHYTLRSPLDEERVALDYYSAVNFNTFRER